MKAFTLNEMENIFEIGRILQLYDCENLIDVPDNKEAFNFALQLALDFEEAYQESGDYYGDLYEFVARDIAKRFHTSNE